MKRSMEVEAKYRLKPDQVPQLRAILGKALAETLQTDRYFEVPSKVLRLRQEGEKIFLTQKGETTLSPEGIKSRFEEERELTKETAALLAEILPWCGHQKKGTVVKKRTTYRRGEVLFCLDRIEEVGDFLEIEGEEEKEVKEAIAWLEKAIDLREDQIELSSYAKLVSEKK
ncbi:MAG TPA: class IV adenylate cyclase [Cyanobacteria bacterium UBA8530]|nr:class IV adenylate cyclase [Cyanobacteria bacterium UBA8530]